MGTATSNRIRIKNASMKRVLAYRMTKDKLSFLIPFHYAFKRMVWCIGFIKGRINGYGH
jgi:hypothetical protein